MKTPSFLAALLLALLALAPIAGALPDERFDNAPAGMAPGYVAAPDQRGSDPRLAPTGSYRFDRNAPQVPGPSGAPVEEGSDRMPWIGALGGAAAGMVAAHWVLPWLGFFPPLLPLTLIGAGVGAYFMGGKTAGLALGGAGAGFWIGAALGGPFGAVLGGVLGAAGGFLASKFF